MSTFNNIRVPFTNAYYRILSIHWRASAMYSDFNDQNFVAVIRNSTFAFMQLLEKG